MISWSGRHFPRSALTIFALLHVEQSLVALLDRRQRPVANVRTQYGHALSARFGPVFEQTVCRRNARRNSMESTGVTVATFPAHAPPRECSTWSIRFLARKATDPESLSQAPPASRKRNNAARIQAPDRRPPDNGDPRTISHWIESDVTVHVQKFLAFSGLCLTHCLVWFICKFDSWLEWFCSKSRWHLFRAP